MERHSNGRLLALLTIIRPRWKLMVMANVPAYYDVAAIMAFNIFNRPQESMFFLFNLLSLATGQCSEVRREPTQEVEMQVDYRP